LKILLGVLISLQEAESLENRFEQLLSPAMRLLSARPQLNYFPTAQPFSARPHQNFYIAAHK
jgi:hypothetical protein